MPRIRLAFVAMLAAFALALAGCIGGGGGTTPTAGGGGMGGTPTGGTPTGGTPTGGTPTGGTPTGGGGVTFTMPTPPETSYLSDSCCLLDADDETLPLGVVSGGRRAANTLSDFGTPTFDLYVAPYIRYNRFDITDTAASSTPRDGIDIQTWSDTLGEGLRVSDTPYNALAYRMLLDYSQALFIGRKWDDRILDIDHAFDYFLMGIRTGINPGRTVLLTEIPDPPMQGTWSGVAAGFEMNDERNDLLTNAHMERLLVIGDIDLRIHVNARGANERRPHAMDVEFSNWRGGFEDYPDGPIMRGIRADNAGFSTHGSWRISAGSSENNAEWDGVDGLIGSHSSRSVGLAVGGNYYGPEHQEIAGNFDFDFSTHSSSGGGSRHWQLEGVFGAKKQ